MRTLVAKGSTETMNQTTLRVIPVLFTSPGGKSEGFKEICCIC